MTVAIIFLSMVFIAGFLYLAIRSVSRKEDDLRKADARKEEEFRRKNELKEKIETGNAAADFDASIGLLHDLSN